MTGFPDRFCECGCGQVTARSQKTRRGYVKGEPLHFRQGHFSRTTLAGPTDYVLIHGRTYSRDRDDYRELCRLCHNRYDRPWESLTHDADGRWVRR